MLTDIDKEIIMSRWAFDPRFTNDTADVARSRRNLPDDMRNSTGVVGCVKHRINLAHSNGLAENIRDTNRVLFEPSQIVVY